MEITSNTPVHRAPGVLAQRLDDEIVLLDAQRGHYFTLNASGAALWEEIGEEGREVDQLEAVLCATFEVEPATASKDLRELLRELETHGLIELGRESDSDRG